MTSGRIHRFDTLNLVRMIFEIGGVHSRDQKISLRRSRSVDDRGDMQGFGKGIDMKSQNGFPVIMMRVLCRKGNPHRGVRKFGRKAKDKIGRWIAGVIRHRDRSPMNYR